MASRPGIITDTAISSLAYPQTRIARQPLMKPERRSNTARYDLHWDVCALVLNFAIFAGHGKTGREVDGLFLPHFVRRQPRQGRASCGLPR